MTIVVFELVDRQAARQRTGKRWPSKLAGRQAPPKNSCRWKFLAVRGGVNVLLPPEKWSPDCPVLPGSTRHPDSRELIQCTDMHGHAQACPDDGEVRPHSRYRNAMLRSGGLPSASARFLRMALAPESPPEMLEFLIAILVVIRLRIFQEKRRSSRRGVRIVGILRVCYPCYAILAYPLSF